MAIPFIMKLILISDPIEMGSQFHGSLFHEMGAHFIPQEVYSIPEEAYFILQEAYFIPFEAYFILQET